MRGKSRGIDQDSEKGEKFGLLYNCRRMTCRLHPKLWGRYGGIQFVIRTARSVCFRFARSLSGRQLMTAIKRNRELRVHNWLKITCFAHFNCHARCTTFSLENDDWSPKQSQLSHFLPSACWSTIQQCGSWDTPIVPREISLASSSIFAVTDSTPRFIVEVATVGVCTSGTNWPSQSK